MPVDKYSWKEVEGTKRIPSVLSTGPALLLTGPREYCLTPQVAQPENRHGVLHPYRGESTGHEVWGKSQAPKPRKGEGVPWAQNAHERGNGGTPIDQMRG